MRLIPFKPVIIVQPGTKLRFVSHYKLAVAETIILALLTIGLFATVGLNLGIDFRGGTLIELRTKGAADVADIRNKVGALSLGETQIQTFGAVDDVAIRVAEQPGGEQAQQAAVAKIRAALGEGVEVRRVEVVGGTVSEELLQGSIIAIIVASIGIFLFLWLRFEWQFSVAALAALAHDIAATLCVLMILQIDFDLTVVAALLTLIGYAVNDTVVMFDRIRENLRKFKKMPLDQLIDLSLNETLARTVMTAGSVLITLVALYVFGGEVIHGFILALLVGTAVSCYTSLFVASPLLYLLGVKRDWGVTQVAGRGPGAVREHAPRPFAVDEPELIPGLPDTGALAAAALAQTAPPRIAAVKPPVKPAPASSAPTKRPASKRSKSRGKR
ncbi:MAG: protein translocase subunit SecF [Hyphomicrobiales bacterium]|nr:protein translocase subunit SecF [Hyphomicrobiales bacterium]